MKHFTFPVLPFIAFVSGFALMTFELAAARVLAPSIGSSTYVWTSVIGVIIAALSVGYWIGGKAADMRNRVTDIVWLCLAVAVSILVVMMVYSPLLNWVTAAFVDARIQGVVASALLFAPTSFLLGMLAPYLVKLKITTLETTGKSYASLSAMESIGGIAGTFITGFILFGYIGARETFAVVVLLVLASSWLLVQKHRWVLRAGLTFAVVTVCILWFATARPHEIDTPTAHYSIVEGVRDGAEVRGIKMGPGGLQSGVYMDGRDDLLFWYTETMADIVSSVESRDSILILGGGAFTLPQYLAEKYPESHITVVEIDPELVNVAREFFYYKDPKNISIVAEDARTFVNKAKTKYDVILVDVYTDASVPFTLMTREYGEQLATITTPKGVVAANMIVGQQGACQEAFASFDAPYRREFNYSASAVDNPDSAITNVVTAYSRVPLQWKASSLGFNAQAPYSDNYAPVERLQQACRSQSTAISR